MFTGELSESKQTNVTMKDVDPLALEMLLEFAYTAEIQVTEENVQVISETDNPMYLCLLEIFNFEWENANFDVVAYSVEALSS